ncbi:DUF2254 domain-containing protein [Gordonia sp. LSe1-13]|uniref:DUF2254 domain-containing protein n=1 Tax=Gordonia sesuvii TaxID=3116777 RepID=A0ABU7MGG0_9ACTN|nr:DUF2254 domain-containing protein [Gordonia sp. LSe1-13]
MRLTRLRDVFWFLPLVMALSAIVLAQVLVEVDRALADTTPGWEGGFFVRVGASGGRDLLGAIGGSMLAVAATSFSITISVLATASSTYGPRLVRNFMNDRGNQFVLGMFGATFLYALMVLRAITAGPTVDTTFVPDIAVNVAVGLAVVDVLVLVYFINHIASSIQVSTLSARVRSELDAVVAELYPDPAPDNAVAAPTPGGGTPVTATGSGFVIGIDETALLRTAREQGCLIAIEVRPGDHLVDGEVLARIHGIDGDDEATSGATDAIRDGIELGETRTPYQDIQFAVQQLTEMAVRALSPGTNDPYTAHNALNELAAGLVPLARRRAPDLGRTDDDGTVRLIVTRLPMQELLDDVFGAVRTYALDAPIAMTAAIMLARRIGVAAVDADVRDHVTLHLDRIDDALDRASDPVNAEFCRGEIAQARSSIGITHQQVDREGTV